MTCAQTVAAPVPAAPAVATVAAPPVAPPIFPAYSVHKGIATIELPAKNGYVHHFRVDVEDIPFLQLCWPFEVSTGGKRKKVIKRTGKEKIALHTVWLMHKHDLRSRWDFSRKPKCRNHDWLDWTEGNVYLPAVNPASESRREAYMAGRLSDRALELIDARQRGSSMSVYGTDDPDIIWAFQDAARVPASSLRARASPKNHGPDSFAATDDDD